MEESTRVLQLSLDRPDPDAMGGVALHAAALALHAPHEVRVYSAHLDGDELLVEEWSPRRLVAALPIADDTASRSATLTAALAGTEAAVLHVHSPGFGPDAITRAVRATGVGLTLSLHDHALVCENYELLEGGSRYCAIPMDPERCDRCLKATRGRAPGALPVWRTAMARLVDATDAVVAPSRSVLEHAARVHPEISARARYVPWGVPPSRSQRVRPEADAGPLRIAIAGVFAKVKGTAQLPALLSACSGLPVEWHLFGATEGASLAAVRRAAPRVIVHGAYRRPALAERLVAAGCHLVLLPSVGAESFSLTLSEVTAAGFPVLGSDLGALGERIREGGSGWVFDPFEPPGFARRVAELSTHREELERVAAHVRATPRRSEEEMARDHAALWSEVSMRRPRTDPGVGQTHASASFEAGVARAAQRRPSRAGAVLDFVKKTDFYRDLPLRRLLPESARKTLERVLRRPSYRARAKERL
jgi:glycosyltransferase involved in cell wall biosynthesis